MILLLTAGCVRHTTVQDYGLTGRTNRPAKSSSDASLRATFSRQTTQGTAALVDDARLQSLRNRVKADPADPAARLDLAAAYEGYRLHAEALEHYTEALALRHSEKAILGIARCNQALNRTWRAIPLLEQFLKESPSAAVWNALGLLHDASGNLPAAEAAFRQATASEPSSDQWHNNLGYNLLLQNKTNAAESEFRKALELNPKSITTHNNLGILFARRGEFDAALSEFQFAADAAAAHNNLAVVLMEMGKYEQSRDELVKALALRRYFAPAMSNFKLVQEHLRQREDQPKVGRLPQNGIRVAAAEQETTAFTPSKDP
jgi:tetratricopeptide (TPR) repeat protein